MSKNIEDILERGKKLDILVDKAEVLQARSKEFAAVSWRMCPPLTGRPGTALQVAKSEEDSDSATDDDFCNESLLEDTPKQDDSSQTFHDLTEFGIGSVVTPIKMGESKINKYNLDKLFDLQLQDGSWKMTSELCTLLGLDYNVCVDTLKEAGIKSLSVKVQEEIITLLATALTLFFIISQVCHSFSYSHMIREKPLSEASQWVKNYIYQPLYQHLVNSGAIQLVPKMENMAEFVGLKDEEYTWASDVLELGKSWTDVAAKMLNVY